MAKQKTWFKVLLGFVVVVAVGAIAVYAVNPETFQGSLRTVKTLDSSVVETDIVSPLPLCDSKTIIYEPRNGNAIYQSMDEFAQAVKDGNLSDCNYHIQGGVHGNENFIAKCTKGFMAGFNDRIPTVTCKKRVGDDFLRVDLYTDHAIVLFGMDTQDSDGFQMSTYKRYDDIMVKID